MTHPGEMVVRIQTRLRDLGYFLFKPTGKFQTMTVNAVINFQKQQTGSDGRGIMSDGTVGEQSLAILFSRNARRAPIAAEVKIPIGPGATGANSQYGALVNWNEVKTLLETGKTYAMLDFNTGKTYNMIYTGGEKHAEMECASAEDTAVYKEIFGGVFSFFKRPTLIMCDGRYIAASLQGQPHGSDTVASNGMTGHACLFFEGSTSHVGSLPDVEHLNQIYKAAGRS
jgi:hypothetical protein